MFSLSSFRAIFSRRARLERRSLTLASSNAPPILKAIAHADLASAILRQHMRDCGFVPTEDELVQMRKLTRVFYRHSRSARAIFDSMNKGFIFEHEDIGRTRRIDELYD